MHSCSIPPVTQNGDNFATVFNASTCDNISAFPPTFSSTVEKHTSDSQLPDTNDDAPISLPHFRQSWTIQRSVVDDLTFMRKMIDKSELQQSFFEKTWEKAKSDLIENLRRGSQCVTPVGVSASLSPTSTSESAFRISPTADTGRNDHIEQIVIRSPLNQPLRRVTSSEPLLVEAVSPRAALLSSLPKSSMNSTPLNLGNSSSNINSNNNNNITGSPSAIQHQQVNAIRSALSLQHNMAAPLSSSEGVLEGDTGISNENDVRRSSVLHSRGNEVVPSSLTQMRTSGAVSKGTSSWHLRKDLFDLGVAICGQAVKDGCSTKFFPPYDDGTFGCKSVLPNSRREKRLVERVIGTNTQNTKSCSSGDDSSVPAHASNMRRMTTSTALAMWAGEDNAFSDFLPLPLQQRIDKLLVNKEARSSDHPLAPAKDFEHNNNNDGTDRDVELASKRPKLTLPSEINSNVSIKNQQSNDKYESQMKNSISSAFFQMSMPPTVGVTISRMHQILLKNTPLPVAQATHSLLPWIIAQSPSLINSSNRPLQSRIRIINQNLMAHLCQRINFFYSNGLTSNFEEKTMAVRLKWACELVSCLRVEMRSPTDIKKWWMNISNEDNGDITSVPHDEELSKNKRKRILLCVIESLVCRQSLYLDKQTEQIILSIISSFTHQLSYHPSDKESANNITESMSDLGWKILDLGLCGVEQLNSEIVGVMLTSLVHAHHSGIYHQHFPQNKDDEQVKISRKIELTLKALHENLTKEDV